MYGFRSIRYIVVIYTPARVKRHLFVSHFIIASSAAVQSYVIVIISIRVHSLLVYIEEEDESSIGRGMDVLWGRSA